MAYEPDPYRVLIGRARADLRRHRALTLELQRDLIRRISASRDVLAASSEALAKAERTLDRQHSF